MRCTPAAWRGAVSLLILRWEAASDGRVAVPVLDADITLVPDGERATLIGLEGVFRRVPGAEPDSGTARRAATAIIRCLLSRIAGMISDPSPGGPEIYLAWPDTPVLTSSLT